MVINTCGWIDGEGYELLLASIDKTEADFVLVIDNERLYSDLSQVYAKRNPNVRVMKLMKSGGVSECEQLCVFVLRVVSSAHRL
jgi:polyribonucleotide 5'-hydroxyl-kinase